MSALRERAHDALEFILEEPVEIAAERFEDPPTDGDELDRAS